MSLLFLTKLGWRNIWRNRRRTLITSIALVVALTLMVLYTGLMEGMVKQMQRNVTHLTVGDYQIHHRNYLSELSIYDQVEDYATLVDKLAEQDIAAAPRWYGYGLISNDRTKKSAGVQMQAIDLELERRVTNLHETKYLHAGQFLSGKVEARTIEKKPRRATVDALLQFGDELFADDETVEQSESLVVEEILLGKKVAKNIQADPGDLVIIVTSGSDGSIGNEMFRVAGVLSNIGDTFDRTRVLMRHQAFTRLFGFSDNQAHEIALNLPAGMLPDQVESNVPRLLAADSVLSSWKEIMPLVADMLTMVDVSTGILTLIIYMAAGMVILNSILMMVFERLREFGIMKAMGYKPTQIVLLILSETVMLTALAVLVGVLLSHFINLYLIHYGLDMTRFAPNGIDFSGTTIDPVMRSVADVGIFVQPVILLFCITLLSAVYPALKAARTVPVDAIYGIH